MAASSQAASTNGPPGRLEVDVTDDALERGGPAIGQAHGRIDGDDGGGPASGRRRDRLGRSGGALLSVLLVVAIAAVLLPAIFFQATNGVVLLKVGAAGLLSFLPGWLYLQFIRNKGQSLYDEYVLNLFRLHIDEYRNLPAPPQHTSYYQLWSRHHRQLGTKTKDNLYRKKFEGVYGKSSVSTFELVYDRPTIKAHTETFAPVLFATVLLCVGWVLVLQPEPWTDIRLFDDLALSGRPQLPNEVLRFGFLGAYSFILQDILRRYFRDDLKTGAYISGVARVVYVTLVLTAVQLIAPFDTRELQQVLGFMVGVFPQIGLQAMQAVLAKPLGAIVPTLEVQHPLSELDGLNIWYEARLAEEGIEDMQNLVSANLVDFMLRSRVPIARLVDWLDQAFLYLHLPVDDTRRPDLARARLRRLGIRTASDLERAWTELHDDPGFAKAVSGALGVPADEAVAAVRSILMALEGEANYWHVKEFKRHDWLLLDEAREAAASDRGETGEGSGGEREPVAARTP